CSSADVIFSVPTRVVIRRSTRPVAGSRTPRPGRITSYSAPTFTPPDVPTLMMISPPDTSATSALIATFVSGMLAATATSCPTILSTAARVASPMIVPPKFELPIVNPPPTAPAPLATPPVTKARPTEVRAARLDAAAPRPRAVRDPADQRRARALGLPVAGRDAQDLGGRRAHDAGVDVDHRLGRLAAEAAEADPSHVHA